MAPIADYDYETVVRLILDGYPTSAIAVALAGIAVFNKILRGGRFSPIYMS